MSDIFKRLRFKFVVASLLIVGVFLLVLFATVWGVIAVNAERQIEDTLKNVLRDDRSPEVRRDKCSIVRIAGDNVLFTSRMENYDEATVLEIINAMVNSGDDTFKAGGYYFQFLSEDKGAYVEYAIYDKTIERYNLNILALVFASAYVVSLGIISLIGWLLSSLAVQPVKEAFVKQKELVANASHELKTPLTIISTTLGAMTAEPASTLADNGKWLENIDNQIKRMDKLILEMLELSKLELDTASGAVKEAVDFSSILKGIFLSLEAVLFEKNINCSTDIEDNVTLKSEKNEIERLALILIENAIKYTPSGGNIEVKLEIKNKYAVFSVKNTGEGIKSENLNRVFDRFFKEDNSRNQAGNNSFGLGLSIARAIVDRNSGVIKCESVAKEFTKFIVSLPCVAQ